MHDITKLIALGNKMIQQEKKVSKFFSTGKKGFKITNYKHFFFQTTVEARNVKSIVAVSNYLQSLLSKLGISKAVETQKKDETSNLLEILVDFRAQVRNKALESKVKDTELLKACDSVRKNLSNVGVDIRVSNFVPE